MIEIKCKHCGYSYYISGISEKEYRELCRQNPDYCDECGEKIVWRDIVPTAKNRQNTNIGEIAKITGALNAVLLI